MGKRPRPGEGLVPEAQEVEAAVHDQDPEVGRGLVVAVTKDDPNPGVEADRLPLKIGLVLEAVQDPDPLTRTIQEITVRTEIGILDLAQEIVEALEADPDPEVQ